MRLWAHPALAVEDRLFRALAILRVVLLVNAMGVTLHRADELQRPALGVVSLVLMTGWTALLIHRYADPERRTTPWVVADLVVAVALVLVSPVVTGGEVRATVPGFWVMAAMLAWAIHWQWRGGLVAGAAVALADLSVRDEVSQAVYGNVFLLVVGGPIVGFMVESLQRMARERDAAQRDAVAGEERARLARAVHDGVLQVLALVQRRGRETEDPQLAELGRLAGEQEARLRSLIRQQDTLDGGDATTDVALALEQLTRASSSVTLSTPGRPVPLPGPVVAELVAAVRTCLDNVVLHVGADAPAWVLLDDTGEAVTVTVRDEGPGIEPGRLATAEADGRLGVSQSIVGRLAELGGSAVLESGSTGTEWELRVPRTTREEQT